MSFTHLHLHSQYSLLDGAIRLKDLYKRLHEHKMTSVAVTDHGNMFGAMDFYRSARKNDIKPIFGCEVYVTPDMNVRDGRKTFHLILLAQNNYGYKNLVYLVSMGYLEGFYYTPRIDKKLLKKHSGGLIGLSACMGGEIPRAIMRRGTQQAAELVREYRDIFEPGNFFLEIQANGIKEQNQVNEELIKLAAKESVGLVATNDCHYLNRKDARAHDILICVQTGRYVSDKKRMKHDTDQLYVKSPSEMEKAFRHVPQALESTQMIADMCDVSLDLSQTYLPDYKVPKGHDYKSYMFEIAAEGLEKRFKEFESVGKEVDREAYKGRLEHELSVISDMGFSGYMLIVWDFMKHAREQGVPVGPGRGCLSPDSKVVTRDGVKNICDVVVGDQVFSHRGIIRKVTKTHQYNIDDNEELLKITVHYNCGPFSCENSDNSITITKDHKVFCQTFDNYKKFYGRGRVMEIKAERLKKGDWFFIPKSMYYVLESYYDFRMTDIGYFTRIKSIERVKGIKKVYDLTVERDSSYLTTSGAVHNSGGGSLVAYSLGITDLDPIPYNLLFERFLNPDRVSMPDFDIDFCMIRRGEVIQYVAQKYGEKNIGQIATFFTMKARSAVRDVARALHIDVQEADKIAKLIPEAVQGKSPTVPEAMEEVPDLKKLAKADNRVADLLDVASALEGLTRHAGVHAAGVVIGGKPIWEYVPCFKDKNNNLVTQFAMNEVEQAGLVKFDFLGLKTLTVIDLTLKMIDKKININMVPLDDPKVFETICSGHTAGIFQIESRGFTELIKKFKPSCFEDIIALVALYRPGPLEGGMVDDFVERKHGRKKVTYMHPCLEPILKPTYGVIVYQEQVMQIAQALAGYSLGMADIMRRVVGKKKPKEMVEQEKVFMDGSLKNGVDEKVAQRIFDLIKVFAGYGFNKSHSACYGFITYQTAYLKTYYPTEFMAAVLTCEKDSIDSLSKYVAAAKDIGVKVLKPDINKSLSYFSVAGPKEVRFGLSALKNIGGSVAESIVRIRKSRPFTGVFDFYERTDSKSSNKKVVESLIKGGAFDSVVDVSRAQMIASMKDAQTSALAEQKDRQAGQMNIFDIIEDKREPDVKSRYQDIPGWSQSVKLAFEKEALGFYISGHPMDQFKSFVRKHANTTTKNIEKRNLVRVCGIISGYREFWMKNGKGKIAIFSLEDQFGGVACIAFNKEFEQYKDVLRSSEPVFIEGMIKMEERDGRRAPKIFLKSVHVLQTLRDKGVKEISVRIDTERASEDHLERFKTVLLDHPGDCMVRVHVIIPGRSRTRLTLSDKYLVAPSDELVSKVEWIFGKDTVVI